MASDPRMHRRPLAAAAFLTAGLALGAAGTAQDVGTPTAPVYGVTVPDGYRSGLGGRTTQRTACRPGKRGVVHRATFEAEHVVAARGLRRGVISRG
jgi:hypothetical protein